MEKEYLFGEQHFKKWGKCQTYQLNYHPRNLASLLDHGFIADRACVWGGSELEGNEMAVISRTYCNEKEIDNPPKGLRCIYLPKETMGKDDAGIAIATVISGPSIEAGDLLNMCLYLPVELIAVVLPLDMIEKGYYISLQYNSLVRFEVIVRIRRDFL